MPGDDPGSQLSDTDVVAAVRALAEDELWPNGVAIDNAPVVPACYLDLLADLGLYGLYGPRSAGGLGVDDLTAARVVEAVGGASMAVASIWMQHHRLVRAVATGRPELRERWLAPLCRGRIRAGFGSGTLSRSRPALVVAEPVGSGWILDGLVPRVVGWDRIGVVFVGARAGDALVWVLIDALATSSVRPAAMGLGVGRAAAPVTVELRRHAVAETRVVDVEPYAHWLARRDGDRQAVGYLAVGVAARCASILGSEPLAEQVAEARLALDAATDASLPTARADASLLAVRAASALIVSSPGRAPEQLDQALRLTREAMVLLVLGQTRPIRDAQLRRLVDRP